MARRATFLPQRDDSLQLGRVLAPQLKFDDAPSQRLIDLQLPKLLTPLDLAEVVSLDINKLQWLCYQSDKAPVGHYHTFTIPKRNGGTRVISSPKPQLRLVQAWIRLNILNKLEPHPRVATAFRPGLSILHNAQPHCKKAIVIRIDLQDFFPSISFRRVKGLFQSIGYGEGMASMLAILCTEPIPAMNLNEGKTISRSRLNRVLPQGACTSPDLANYLCRKMDYRIESLAKSLGFTYTRYADDLVFSHKQKRGKIDILVPLVYKIVRNEGFEPNQGKTMVMRHCSRQVVTGLIVNDTPRVSRKDMRRFRAIAHQYRTLGPSQTTEKLGRDAKQYLLGYISYVSMINKEQAEQLTALIDT